MCESCITDIYFALVRLSFTADVRYNPRIPENVYRLADKYYHIRFMFTRHIRHTCVISE